MCTEDSKLAPEEVNSAVDVLEELLSKEDVDQVQPSSPNTVYTTLVTLWMLILQRLGGGKSLEGVVKEVVSRSGGLLPDNKRVREKTLSLSSAAYCEARQRLKLSTVEYFADRVSSSLIDLSPPAFEDRRA